MEIKKRTKREELPEVIYVAVYHLDDVPCMHAFTTKSEVINCLVTLPLFSRRSAPDITNRCWVALPRGCYEKGKITFYPFNILEGDLYPSTFAQKLVETMCKPKYRESQLRELALGKNNDH